MQFQYQGPRMRGAQNTFQQWSITPLSSNQYWMPNQVIKLMSNISQGLIDPYRSHLEFEIQTTAELLPVGLLQVDSSAQSIINQSVCLSNQQQIQRIQQYDVLACVLTDIGFSQYVCNSRSGQGLGYSNISSNPWATSVNPSPKMQVTHTTQIPADSYVGQKVSSSTFLPTMAPQYGGSGYVSYIGSDVAGSATSQLNSSQPNNYQSFNNWLSFPYGDAQGYTLSTGRALSVRAENYMAPLANGYPDTPYSLPLVCPQVKNQKWSYSTMLSKGFDPTCPYETTYSKPLPGMQAWQPLPQSKCGYSGYVKPLSAEFSTGCNQPFISAVVPQLQMVQGRVLPQPVPLARKTFRVPLISAVIGCLIPPDQFQLLPAQAFKNFILQLTLNPYALFTSGYSDVHQYDDYGMQVNNMQKRNWRITRFQWNWHLYTFRGPQILGQIQQKISRGIDISSNYWQLSAQYQLPNGSYVRNSFQIPTNVESLAEVLIVFLDNNYQTKTFCRKNFRLSNNITSMQFKANGAWYPLQPILGNAGNPQNVGTSGDNWNFYECLLLSNNFLFSTNFPLPKINQKNFAINGRCYDVNNIATLLPKSTYNRNGDYGQMNQILGFIQDMNADTALGQCWFHENRFRGTAVFPYSFQPYGHSKQFITGLNTIGFRQFDVIFNNSPTNVFPTDETLLIFTRANVIYRYREQGIILLGA